MRKISLFSFVLMFACYSGNSQTPVAAYSFNNGNAQDDIGLLDGTVNGAVLTKDRFGNPNKAYKFTNGQFITLPNSPVLKSPVMSVSLWVKVDGYNPSSDGSTQNWIYSVINSTTSAYFGAFTMAFRQSQNEYFGGSQNSPGESVYDFTTDTVSSNWKHYVLTMDNDSIKTYLNNQLQWKHHKGFITTFTADPVFIGSSGNPNFTGFLNGCVDDIKIFDHVLTGSEVATLYNEPNPATTATNDLNNDRNRIVVYPNPTSAIISLSVPLGVTIIDITGKVLDNWQATKKIDIQNYPSGHYYLILRNSKGEIIQKEKIVKY
jgi:hypothetical protein